MQKHVPGGGEDGIGVVPPTRAPTTPPRLNRTGSKHTTFLLSVKSRARLYVHQGTSHHALTRTFTTDSPNGRAQPDPAMYVPPSPEENPPPSPSLPSLPPFPPLSSSTRRRPPGLLTTPTPCKPKQMTQRYVLEEWVGWNQGAACGGVSVCVQGGLVCLSSSSLFNGRFENRRA